MLTSVGRRPQRADRSSPHRFCLYALCRVFVLPGVEAAFQGGSLVAYFVELPRHPGAGSLVRSGAVGDDALALDLAAVLHFPLSRPPVYLIGGDPYGAGDVALVLFVLGTGPDVEHDGWIFAL